MAGSDLFGWIGSQLRGLFGGEPPRATPVEAAPPVASPAPQPAPAPEEPVEDAPAPPPLDPAALDERLAAVTAEPTSLEARQVFGDWLEGQGHPWGRLVALHHAMATAPEATRAGLAREADRWARANRAALLGDLPAAGGLPRVAWEYGFLGEAVVASPGDGALLAERLRALLALPAARLIRKITLHCEPAVLPSHRDGMLSEADVISPWGGVVAALADAPPTLRALAFGEPPPTSAAAYVSRPDLPALAAALPRLEALDVQCRGGEPGLGPFRLPMLRSLEIRLGMAHAADLQAIRASELPALERLVVGLGAAAECTLDDVHGAWADDSVGGEEPEYPETYPSADLDRLEVYDSAVRYTVADLRAFLDGPWPPGLVHLGLTGATLTPDALAAVLDAPVIRQLRTLDLSGGTLRDPAVDVLLRAAGRLAHLTSISLGGNQLTPRGVVRLRSALPRIEPGVQRELTEGPAFLFRYVATME